MEQRFIDLAFQQSGQQLTATLPSDPTVLVPGYYMLFAFDQAGVPSIAQVLFVDPTSAVPPVPISTTSAVPPTSTSPEVAKDFDSDNQADLVWENEITGQRGIWTLKNGVRTGSIPLPTIPTEWHIAGVGDFLGNGQADLVWENEVTGQRGIWTLTNGVWTGSIPLPTIPTQWHIEDH